MAKKVDVSDAAKWTQEEADYNRAYLWDRGRYDEARRIDELRAPAVEEEPKKTRKKAKKDADEASMDE